MTRAVVYDGNGGPEVLHLVEVADAAPGPGKVAVRVRAAGLNPFDAKMRSGFIPSEAAFPRRIGSDLAGTVEAVGEGAVYWDGTAIAVGDEVLGRASGALAERVVASASGLTRRPAAVPVEVAAGLNVPGLTAVSCLVTVPVGAGDTVLVGGAAGAVGIVAAQLALAQGARVIGTASERNGDLLRSIGALPVTYGEGLADRVAGLGGSLTAVIDTHGREALDAGIALGVSPDRMVAIAAYAAVDELGVHNAEREARTAANLADLVDRIAAGMVFPVAETFALDDVVRAFEALEAPHAPGKIIVLA